MQRYRVNYTLMVGLIVGVLVCSVSAYALWRFQVERNAGDLLVQADKLEQEGKVREAEQYLRNYLTVRPDDREVEIRHANLWADIGANKPRLTDWTGKDFQNARFVIETALRKYQDEDKLRRRQVDLALMAGNSMLKEAIFHLDILLNHNSSDAELMRMRTLCLFRAGDSERAREYANKLIGYDVATDSFDVAKAGAPGEPAVYRSLAFYLRDSDRKPELADRVMNQLVEANLDKPAAYLQRADYCFNLERKDEAKADLQKALELGPKDADALVAMAELQLREMQEDVRKRLETDPAAALTDEAVAACRQLLETGLAEHPTDIRFYQYLARLELAKKDYKASMQHVDEGLAKVDENLRISLLNFKAELQIGEQDLIGTRQTAAEIRDSGIFPRVADYIEARCLMGEERWFEARQLLEELKPAFENSPPMLTQINYQIGLCSERLDQPDRAVEAYRLVLGLDPTNAPAAAGITRVNTLQGVPQADGAGAQSINRRLALELQKPKEEQDWAAFDKMVLEHAKKLNLPESGVVLLQVEILMRRGEFVAAREKLKVAYEKDKDDLNVRRAAYKLVANDPELGPEKALQLLEGVVEKFGDSPQLRLDKADLIVGMSNVGKGTQTDTQLKDKLMALSQGISEWTLPQQVQLWSGLGTKFLQIRLRDDAEACWKKVAELAPGDLATRVMLFKIARDENDDAGMQAAQEDILEIVGSRDNSTWQFTEAHRLMSLVARGMADNEAIKQADGLVAMALLDRPAWNELLLLRAEMELRRGNEAAALASYDQAMKLGRASLGSTLQYAQLLVRRGRWIDAREVLELLEQTIRQRVLGQLYAEVLLNTGSPDEAMQTADVVVETDPENAAKQLWFGQFILRTVPTDKKFEISAGPMESPELAANPPAESEPHATPDEFTPDRITIESAELTPAEREALAGKLEKAGKALAKAVEFAPNSGETWLPWVTFLVSTKQLDRAAEAIRQAQLALPEDEQPLLLARCYEITGRWFDAENLYRSAVDNNPNDVRALRLLATYYLGNGYPIEANRHARATPLINRILQAAAEGNAEATDENVQWARRTAAEILAATGDYQNLLKAENLLASNAVGGVLAVEDQLRMAQILGPRPEPISKVKALHLLADVKRNQRLNTAAELVLGQLYASTGDWDGARRHMFEIISRNQAAVEPRVAFMRMLLQRGGTAEISEASRQLDQLAKYAPGSPQIMEMMVLLAIKTGKENDARAALVRLVPDLNKIDEDAFPVVGRIAELFTQLKDYDNAEKIYRFIADKQPQFVPALATFLGNYREPDQCFELLEKLQGQLSPQVLNQSALAVLRQRRDDFGDKYDARVQTWLDRALRDDPEAITLLLQQAELYDIEAKYDEAAAIYRNLLKRKDLEGRARAIVMNNLAFLLALGGAEEASNGEALNLVQDAVSILGPTADILDTRAVVFMAQKQYSDAIADLELAVTTSPTASNWYHKAQAHLAAKDADEAEQAWGKAVSLGLSRDSLNRMEWDRYEQTKQQMESSGARSASL